MKHRLLCIITLLPLIMAACAVAQTKLTDSFPPLPKFDLKDNYSALEREYVEKSVVPYYGNPTTKTLEWPKSYVAPSISPLLFQNAFTIENTIPTKNAEIILIHPIYDSNSKRHAVFNLKKIIDSVPHQAYYHFSKTTAIFHSPLFSPNGKTILFREGYPPDDRYNGNNLFLWDLAIGRLRFIKPGPADSKLDNAIFLPQLQWSPGSRFVSYLRGGNTFGDYDPNSKPYVLYCLDTPSRQDRTVLKDSGLHWSWNYSGQLLCSRVPAVNAGEVFERTARPSVYIADALKGEPRKLFDGGYYAQESPDGNWVAFCDWPGRLFDAQSPSKELEENQQKGLFFFNKTTKQRAFVGDLALEEVGYPADAPLMQWSPDGKFLYLLEWTRTGKIAEIAGKMYRVALQEKKLESLGQITIKAFRGLAYFRGRGISPDGKSLYIELREAIEGPKGYPNQQFNLIAVDTQNGRQTTIARLKNIANENPDWDWRDESGANPSFITAEKREAALVGAP